MGTDLDAAATLAETLTAKLAGRGVRRVTVSCGDARVELEFTDGPALLVGEDPLAEQPDVGRCMECQQAVAFDGWHPRAKGYCRTCGTVAIRGAAS